MHHHKTRTSSALYTLGVCGGRDSCGAGHVALEREGGIVRLDERGFHWRENIYPRQTVRFAIKGGSGPAWRRNIGVEEEEVCLDWPVGRRSLYVYLFYYVLVLLCPTTLEDILL